MPYSKSACLGGKTSNSRNHGVSSLKPMTVPDSSLGSSPTHPNNTAMPRQKGYSRPISTPSRALPLEEQATPNQGVFERNLETLTEFIYSDPRHQRALRIFLGSGKEAKINCSVLRYLCGEGSYSTHGQHIGLSKQSFHYHANQLKEKIFRNFGIKLERSD